MLGVLRDLLAVVAAAGFGYCLFMAVKTGVAAVRDGRRHGFDDQWWESNL